MYEVFFGQFLLKKNAAKAELINDALRSQLRFNKCIGELAISRGQLMPEEADDLFAAQAADRRPFGRLAVDRGYLSQENLDELLFMQTVHCKRLGEMLYEKGVLSEPGFSALLAEYEALESEQRSRLQTRLASGDDGRSMLYMLEAMTLTLARFCGVVCKATCGIEPCAAPQGEEYGLQVLLCDNGNGERRPLSVVFSRSTMLALSAAQGDCANDAAQGGWTMGNGNGDWLDGARALFGKSAAFCSDTAPCLVEPAGCRLGEPPHPCENGVTLHLGLYDGNIALMHVYPPGDRPGE